MSIIDILEERMQDLFEGNRTVVPLPFKKLAKSCIQQMKHNAIKLDGNTFPPTLYTILVNPQDDRLMATIYLQVTHELADYLAHEAENVKLPMQEMPLVRFIADQSVHVGKFDVIAEVVPGGILESLREEERSYASSRMPGAGLDMGRGRGGSSSDGDAGQHAQYGQQQMQAAQRQQARSQHAAAAAQQYAPQAESARAGRSTGGHSSPGACELRDLKTGQTWQISKNTVLGRDAASADLVLDDTNVSRRHARLDRDQDGWTITDLGSTNGTRVNQQRVNQALLSDGDTITVGIINLGFREI